MTDPTNPTESTTRPWLYSAAWDSEVFNWLDGMNLVASIDVKTPDPVHETKRHMLDAAIAAKGFGAKVAFVYQYNKGPRDVFTGATENRAEPVITPKWINFCTARHRAVASYAAWINQAHNTDIVAVGMDMEFDGSKTGDPKHYTQDDDSMPQLGMSIGEKLARVSMGLKVPLVNSTHFVDRKWTPVRIYHGMTMGLGTAAWLMTLSTFRGWRDEDQLSGFGRLMRPTPGRLYNTWSLHSGAELFAGLYLPWHDSDEEFRRHVVKLRTHFSVWLNPERKFRENATKLDIVRDVYQSNQRDSVVYERGSAGEYLHEPHGTDADGLARWRMRVS